MKRSTRSFVAAAIIAGAIASASGAGLKGSRPSDAHSFTALKTNVETPSNPMMKTGAGEGKPRNLHVTTEATERPPEHREPPAKHLVDVHGKVPVHGPATA